MKYRFFTLVFLLLTITITGAQPDRKNAYYAAWENGPPTSPSYFPIAVWYQKASLAKQYQAAGVNTYISPAITASQLPTLKAASMYAIADYSSTLKNHADADEVIIGWKQIDEPDIVRLGDGCLPVSTIQQKYAEITKADPTRPVYCNFGKGVAHNETGSRGTCSRQTWMYPEYIRGADITSFDIYPVADDDIIIGDNLWYVGKGIDSLRMWSDYKKPAWCWIECTHIKAEVMATPEQTRSEVWMAIIHEAAGIGYFCHEWYPSFSASAWLGRYPDMKKMITRTNREITELAPVLNSPTISDMVDVEITWRNRMSTMVKSYGGSTYLLAITERNRTDDAVFRFGGNLPANCVAEVIGENRTLQVKNGVLSDSFSPYECHIYKINAPVSVTDADRVLHNRLQRTVQLSSPVRTALTVRLLPERKGHPLTVSVRSLDGAEKARMETDGTTPELRLALDHQAPGLYQVLISSEGTSVIKPLCIVP